MRKIGIALLVLLLLSAMPIGLPMPVGIADIPLVEIEPELDTSPETIAQMFSNSFKFKDWSTFWKFLKKNMNFRLEYGNSWNEEENSLLTFFQHEEEREMKYIFNFTAQHTSDYRIAIEIRLDTVNFTEYDWYFELEYENFTIQFDWSDLEGTPYGWESEFEGKKYRFYIYVDDVVKDDVVVIDPKIVGTTNDVIGAGYGLTRMSFYAEGLFWVFYSANWNDLSGTDLPVNYGTSPDSETWTEHNTDFDVSNGDVRRFGVAYNGSHIGVVRVTTDTFMPTRVPSLSFRLGIPESDGSITWVAVWQNLRSGSASDYDRNPIPECDSTGLWFVGTWNRVGGAWYHTVYRNTVKDGTWVEGGVVNLRSASGADGYYTFLTPTSGTNMYAICTKQTGDIARGFAWDGASWGAEQAVTGVNLNKGWYGGAVGQDDGTIFYGYRSATDNTPYYTIRTPAGTWGSVTQISARTGTDLSVTLGTNNDVYFFYTDVTYDTVYYRMRDRSSGALGVETTFGVASGFVADFPGVGGDYGKADAAGLKAETFTSVTLSFRMRWQGGTGWGLIFRRGTTANNSEPGTISSDKYGLSTTILFRVILDGDATDHYIQSVDTPADGAWHWVFGEYNTTHLNIYVDSTSVDASNNIPDGGTIGTCLNATWIGQEDNLWEVYDGKMDDLRLYNRTLTPTEKQDIMDKDFDNIPRNGLILECLFNEGSGSTYEDTSGNDYDMTLGGTATWAVEDGYVITNSGTMTSFSQAWEENIGGVWLSNSTSPFDINFNNLSDPAFPYISSFVISNREIGADIIKTDYKWYNVEMVSYASSALTKDHIGLRFNTSDGLTYLLWYNVTADTYTYTQSTSWMVENVNFTNTNGFSTLSWDMYLLSYVADTALVDFEGYVNTTSGATSNWDGTAGANYCDLLSFGGITKYTTLGTAGRIDGGDWINIYADKDSSARVEYITNNIQGMFMSVSLNPAYGWTNLQERNAGGNLQDQKGNYSFGMDYSIDGIGWIEGWRAEMYLYESNLEAGTLATNQYMHWKVNWYRGDTLIKTEDIAVMFWGINSGDDRANFVIRFWFNRENASSVVGGWISPKEYGATKEGAWYFGIGGNWGPVTTVGVNDTQCVKSFLFASLPDENENTIGYKRIDTTRFWANVTRSNTGDVGQQYRIESVEAMEIQLGGHQDSHHSYGILTPAPIQPAWVDKGILSGVVRWLNLSITGAFRQVTQIFYNAVDGLLLFITGEEGIFSSLMRVIGLATGNFMTSVNLVLQEGWTLFTTYITGAVTVFTNFIRQIFRGIRALISPATSVWNALSNTWSLINAWLTGIEYTAPWGNTYDFSNMAGVNFAGYTAGWAVLAGLLGLYIVMYIPVMGIAMGNGGIAAGIDYALAPFRVMYFVGKILWWCVAIPFKILMFLRQLFFG